MIQKDTPRRNSALHFLPILVSLCSAAVTFDPARTVDSQSCPSPSSTRARRSPLAWIPSQPAPEIRRHAPSDVDKHVRSFRVRRLAASSDDACADVSSERPWSFPSPRDLRPFDYSCLYWSGDPLGDGTEGGMACAFSLKRKDDAPVVGGVSEASYDMKCFGFSSSGVEEGDNNGRSIHIYLRELPFSLGKLAGPVWFSGIALAQYMAIFPDLVKNKSVLELGSGVGIAGIMAAKLGAQEVLLTDFGYEYDLDQMGTFERQKEDLSRLLPLAALPNIQFNVNLNDVLSNTRVEHLDWNDHIDDGKRSKLKRNFNLDLIIGSDLVYDETAVEPLIATILHLLKKSTLAAKAVLVIPEKDRKALPLFLDSLCRNDSLEHSIEYIKLVDRRASEKKLLLVTIKMMRKLIYE